MLKRYFQLLGCMILVLLIVGCSGSSPVTPPEQPASPDVSDLDLSAMADGVNGSENGRLDNSGHALWGLWQGSFNTETLELELVRLRDAQFHVNITGQLQPPMPPGITIHINDFNPAIGIIDLDMTIKHPFAGSNLRGFDVRGIVMGAGDTLTSKLDSGVIYSAPNGMRLENADGYSRWWNAQEFTTPGMYGFTPGNLGMGFFSPPATLNPFKYFSDPLNAVDPVVPKVNMTNRGTFSTDMTPPELTRNFRLQFPIGAGGNPIWLFQYAIDANWAPPTGSSPPPKPITDFPMAANSPEAFHIAVDTTGTTAYFVDNSDIGGDLVLAVEVFDWGADANPDGINGEISSIWIESETLFDSVINLDLTPAPGSQTTSGVYTITVPGVHPSGLEDQEVLITVKSSDPTTYAPPMSGPDYPSGANLAAYNLVSIPISDSPPPENYIQVDIPNGGEVWHVGGSEDIMWTSVGNVGDHVGIGYNINDGPFNPIVPSTENDGSFTWDPIPDVDSDQVKISVTSVENPSINDQSDDFFTIEPTTEPLITVIIPNGSEVWEVGSAQEITWMSEGPVGPNVVIEFSLSDSLVFPITPSTENDGGFLWDPIPDIDSQEVRIIVSDIENLAVSDSSDEYFTITPEIQPEITVLVPNGGEIWQVGDAENIEWTSLGDVGYEVSIDYTIDDGPPVNIVPFTDNDESFLWVPIPDVESDLVKIIVTSVEFPLVFDESDDFFTITDEPPPQITVTVPNGGESWIAGTAEEITWDSMGPVGFEVRIDYTIDDGPPINIVSTTDNDGSYMWDPIPDLDSDTVKVVVTSFINPLIFDESDDYFSIHALALPEITVIVPNGGEIWEVGSAEEIEWTSEGPVSDHVKIEYMVSWGPPVLIVVSTENDGSYIWDPIPVEESDQVIIRISDALDPLVNDESDDFFTITSSPVPGITVNSPNGGEDLIIGEDFEITWTSENLTGNIFIEYSKDDFVSDVNLIEYNVPDTGSFLWQNIPDDPSDTVRVRVSSSAVPGVFDDSDDYFSIEVAKKLTVTSPNGGEGLDIGGSWEITWTSTGNITDVVIEYSTDSGGSYPNVIAVSTENDGSYIWDPIPDTPTVAGRVRITDAGPDPAAQDESDGDFTIEIGVDDGWLPIPGLTQFALTAPAPDQGTEPVDIMIYSTGSDASRGEIVDGTDSNLFQQYNDTYTDIVGDTWNYATFAAPLHKFDVLPAGDWVFVVNSNTDTFPNDSVNDPMYCAFTCNDNTTGESSDTFWHLFGDGGAPGDPDPDALPWRRVVDFSCGVPGGLSDTLGYHLVVYADHPDNPQPHPGNLLLGEWDTPYDNDALNFYFLGITTQGGGSGEIDDTNPAAMALAVDDDVELWIGPDPVTGMWVLDSASIVQSVALAFETGDNVISDNQLDSDEFGTATPVDIEIAPAKAFGFTVTDTGYNWLVVLLDNGDGTWSLGVWEFDYMADPVVFVEIDITEPIPGTPMALDVDGEDFEIHVLADNAGTIEATVFDYTP